MKPTPRGEAAHHKFRFLKFDAALEGNIIGINHVLVG